MRKSTKRLLLVTSIILLLTVLIAWIAWSNKALVVSAYTVTNEKVPKCFSGFRIAQISDLHNDEFGDGNQNLLQMLESSQPDIIAITGDLIDFYNTDLDISLDFVAKAVKIAPCYYIPGNHEARIAEYLQFRDSLEALGVTVLENEKIQIEREGQSVTLLGINDPGFLVNILYPDLDDDESTEEYNIIVDLLLRSLPIKSEEYNILLVHRPDQMHIYAQYGFDLVLSGHKHGAQFRLPILGGLYTPSDGFFPEYDAGLYEEENTTMIISRGLGNSTFPFRINNRPELVLIELQPE